MRINNLLSNLLKTALLISVVVFAVLSCEKQPPRNIVAKVGGEEITYGEFLLSYLTMPKFRSNITEREARLAQVNYLTDRMHLYLAAEADGLGELPEIREKVEYIRNREMLKYLYQKEIWEKIPVSDEEAWEEYKRHNIEVKVRHLFADTKEKAEAYYRRLQAGETFEALAREAFRDSVLAANGGDLGWLTVNNLDPLLVDSVYAARIGIPTHPLRSSFGWHVFKVEDVKQNVFLSRDVFENNKDYYINELRSRRADRQSEAFVKQVLKGKSVTIKGDVLSKLLQVNQTHLTMKRRESPLPAPPVDDLQLFRIARDSEEFLNRPLVKFTGGEWTVKDVLEKIRQMPPMQRPEKLYDRNALASHIIDMVRDQYLIDLARSRGYDKAEPVVKEVRRWRRAVMADEFQKRLQLVAYKQQDPQKWQQRRELLQQIKARYTPAVDTTKIFQDLKPEELNRKVKAIPIVLKSSYLW